MTWRRVANLVRYLHGIAGRDNGSGLTDGELLARYVARRDEAAFELLLWRHGALVHNVCRRVLHAEADAEDAFQATFLTFVRKAHTIRGSAVGGWLHKVAYRVALEARARAAKTARQEQPGAESLAVQAPPDPAWRELRPILDEEISRIPERLRVPLVLCYLEGKTNEEAARQLGCPPGTIYSRLARGRELLRGRLLRRGVTLSGGVLAAVVCGNAAAAAPGTGLVASTYEAALLFAAGKASAGRVPAKVAALAEGVLQTMFWTRIKLAALAVVLVGLLTAGGALTLHALRAEDTPETTRKDPAGKAKATRAADKPPAVRVAKPVPGGLGLIARHAGTVQPFARQRIHATVPGFLKEQSVDIGDRVKKGQLLAVIDAPLLALDVEQAKAALDLAKGAVEEAEARVVTAEAAVRVAKSNVAVSKANVATSAATLSYRENVFRRNQALKDEKVVDPGVVDEAKGQVSAARAAVAAATASRQSAEADVAVSEGKLRQAQALLFKAKTSVRMAELAVEKARAHLAMTRLTAAYDGVVTSRLYSVGDYIPANETAGRQPLLTIARVDLMRVVVEVAENEVPHTEIGAPAEVTLAALPGVKIAGKVSRIAFGEDEKTRTMKVEIDVANPKGQLRPGMFANTTIQLEKPSAKAFTLPQSSLMDTEKGGDRATVFVVRDGKARATRVRVGTLFDAKAEILSGLKPTDFVVTDPTGLTDGAAVKVTNKP